MAGTVCIVNPRSGGGRTGDRWAAIAACLAQAGLEPEIRMTERVGEGLDLARQALRGGADFVIACGGDGTIHEVANGFFAGDGTPLGAHAKLGVIPAGTGSDLIKSLGLPRDPLEACAVLASGQARNHDLARITYTDPDGAPARRWSINIASVGMTANVLQKMARLPGWVHGQARYILGSALGLVDLKPFELQWSVDGVAQEPRTCLFVAVGTGGWFGAGMHVLPQAICDDGLLDAMVLESRPPWELAPRFPRIYAGTHLDLPMVHSARGRRFELNTDQPLEVDGELAGNGPVTIEVAAAALRVVIRA